MPEERLSLYDFYLVSYFPVFLALVLELFLSLRAYDVLIDDRITHQLFSIHWTIRVLVFLFVAYSTVYRLQGKGRDGLRAGMFIGFFLGFVYGLFYFIRFPSVATFFDFLALPWQTVLAGGVITGLVTLFLSLWKKERERLIH